MSDNGGPRMTIKNMPSVKVITGAVVKGFRDKVKIDMCEMHGQERVMYSVMIDNCTLARCVFAIAMRNVEAMAS